MKPTTAWEQKHRAKACTFLSCCQCWTLSPPDRYRFGQHAFLFIQVLHIQHHERSFGSMRGLWAWGAHPPGDPYQHTSIPASSRTGSFTQTAENQVSRTDHGPDLQVLHSTLHYTSNKPQSRASSSRILHRSTRLFPACDEDYIRTPSVFVVSYPIPYPKRKESASTPFCTSFSRRGWRRGILNDERKSSALVPTSSRVSSSTLSIITNIH